MTFHLGLDPWFLLGLLIIVAAAVGFAFEKVVIGALRRLTKGTKNELDDFVLKALHPALLVFVTVAVLLWGIREYGANLPPELRSGVAQMGNAIVIALLALFVARLLQGALQYRARDNTQWLSAATLGGRLGGVIIYVLGFLFILDAYNVEITPLLTSLGIAGIAVALALQETLANFFAGIWLQTGRAFKPGHFIRVEDANIEGYVVEVGWRTTKIRTLPNNMVILPNTKMFQSVVTDYYLPSTRMSVLIEVNVGYEEDPARVERILIEEAKAAAETTAGLLKDPEPFVRLIPGFGEYALKFTLIVQVREFTDQYLAQHEIRKRILRRFREEDIRIPFPTRETIQRVGPPAE